MSIDLTLALTTGAGPMTEGPGPPKASLQHYAVRSSVELTTCDNPANGTCLALPNDAFVEQLYLDGVNNPANLERSLGVHGPYLLRAP
ncbi:MAG TPA: hypothetical protein VGF45_21330 [Polyangia bacterium]